MSEVFLEVESSEYFCVASCKLVAALKSSGMVRAWKIKYFSNVPFFTEVFMSLFYISQKISVLLISPEVKMKTRCLFTIVNLPTIYKIQGKWKNKITFPSFQIGKN